MSERATAAALRELSSDAETQSYVDCLRRKYPTPVKHARRLVDQAMGDRTLTGELYKSRNEEAM